MTWFKVDDTLAFHHKTIEAGNAAMGLWVRAGAWSAQNLTDGFIPHAIARQLGTKSQISRLLTARLWAEQTGGYSFHEWGDRQPTKQDVEADREANRKRQAEHRKRKREARNHGATNSNQSEKRNAVTPQSSNGVTADERNAVTNRTHARADPDPTRPDLLKNSPSVVVSPEPTRDTQFADGTPIPEPPPPSDHDPNARLERVRADMAQLAPQAVETHTTPVPIHPSSAVQTLLRYTLPAGLPREFTRAVGRETQRLLNQHNIERIDIETALRELGRRSDARPGLLPHLVADAARARNAANLPTAPTKPSKLRGIAELAAAERALENAPHQQEIIR